VSGDVSYGSPRNIVAIYNPISGRRSAFPVLKRIKELVDRAGSRLEILETEYAGHAIALATSIDPRADVVLVAGGDGTIGEVVNGLGEQIIPLALLATGTENLLARQSGIPCDPRRAAEALLRGKIVTRDAGTLNGRVFLSVVGVGFDAECVRRLGRDRRVHVTRADYFWPIWRTFWEYRHPVLRVEIDGAALFEGPAVAIIGLDRRYAAGLPILPLAAPSDGLLDVAVFPCRNRRRLVAHAARVVGRRHIGRGGVVYRQCRAVRVLPRNQVPVQVDGELMIAGAIECSVLSGRIRLAVERADRPA